jgi:hypothetical protein
MYAFATILPQSTERVHWLGRNSYALSTHDASVSFPYANALGQILCLWGIILFGLLTYDSVRVDSMRSKTNESLLLTALSLV